MVENEQYIYYKIILKDDYKRIKLDKYLEKISPEIIKKILLTDKDFNEDYLCLLEKDSIKYCLDEKEGFEILNKLIEKQFSNLYIRLELKDNKYIYYKINDNSQFYIIPFKKDNLKSITKTEIKGFLYNEGFSEEDTSLINSIKYNFKKDYPKEDLKEDIVSIPDNIFILYIYLEINDDKNNPSQIEKNDYDQYKSNMDELQKKIDELSQDISSGDMAYKLVINKNQEFSEQQKLLKIYGINQNIDFDKNIKKKEIENNENNENKGISLYYLFSFPLSDIDNQKNINKGTGIGSKKGNDKNLKEIKNNIPNIFNRERNQINDLEGKNENIKKENDKLINEDYIYYNQIFTIYEEFKNSQIKANLKFEPINENIEEYLEQGPDILHIKINSFLNKKYKENNLYFKLELYGNGNLIEFSADNLKIAFEVERNVSNIKLLILSSQNIEEIEKLFKNIKIQNIIFINSSESYEKEENIFIKSLYKNLLEGNTIEKSFNESKEEIKNKNIVVKLRNNNKNVKFNKTKLEINLNKNCSLNLNFVKYNYKRVFGRNLQLKECIIQFKKNKKICIYGVEGVGKKSFAQKVGYYLYERNLINNVYYLELYSLDDISKTILKLKIEEIIYNINNNIDNIGFDNKNILIIIYLKLLIKREDYIKSFEKIINELNDYFYYLFVFTISEQIDRKENKTIINFASIKLEPFDWDDINKEKIFNNLLENIKINDDLRKELLTKAEGCNCQRLKEKKNQEKQNKTIIKQKHDTIIKLKKEKRKKIKETNIEQQKKEEKDKKDREREEVQEKKCDNGCSKTCPYDCPNGCPGEWPNTPNDIYLRALYTNLFYGKIESKNMSNLKIIVKILEYKKENIEIKKIFSIFCILKYGINEDIFVCFFNKDEIEFIKTQLNCIIFVEKNEKESIYSMENSYIELIYQIFLDKFYDILLNNLAIVLEKYALVFKLLAYNSDFPYNLIMQLDPDNDFWNEDPKNFDEIANKKIYFDDVVYSNNVFYIFNYKDFIYETIIHKQKDRENRENENDLLKGEITISDKNSLLNYNKNYIYQIALYLPTILYFKNSFLYRDFILDFFIDSLEFFDFEKKEYEIKLMRLKMLKYFISDKSNFSIIEESTKKENMNHDDIYIIYYLIKIFDNKNKSEEISNIFEKCISLIAKGRTKDQFTHKDYYNLGRVHLLYYMKTNDKIYLEELEKIKENLNNNLYLELRIELLNLEDNLKNNEFDKFDLNIKKLEEEIIKNKDKVSLRNSDINIKILDLKNQKNKIFNDYIKKKFFFFSSNPFYNKDGKPLNTEANNSFYLKYKLKAVFPNMQIDFQGIDKNLSNLKKCLNYPIKFLYIGSDGYNKEGNLILEDNFSSFIVPNQDIKNIIENSKYKEACDSDIVILGILNNDENNENSIYNIFKSKFRHIIYFKKDDDLIELFNNEPLFYCYFQNCFFYFIKEFINNLSKSKGYLTIREAFIRAQTTFNLNLKKINLIIKDHKNFLCLGENVKIYDHKNFLCLGGNPKYDDDICDFGFINDENFDSYINQKNIIKNNNKELYEEYVDEEIKKNNIYFRKNPFKNVNEEENTSSAKDMDKKFPSNYFLKDEQLEKRLYSMKPILENLITMVMNNKIVNLFGNKYFRTTKLCVEICKYFFMNNYFKKGIYILELKYFFKIQKMPELKNRINNKNNINQNEVLIVLVNAEKIKDHVWKWIYDLNAKIIISTSRKLNDDLLLENSEQNEINENKEHKKFNKHKQNKNDIEKAFKSEIKEKKKDTINYFDLNKSIENEFNKNQDKNKEKQYNEIMNNKIKILEDYKTLKMISIQ